MQGSRWNNQLAQSAQGCELSVPCHAASPIAAKMLSLGENGMMRLRGYLQRRREVGSYDGKQGRVEFLSPVAIKLNPKECIQCTDARVLKHELKSQSLGEITGCTVVWRRVFV